MRPAQGLAVLLALAALFAKPLPALADSGDFPYKLSPVTDGAIAVAALGLYGSSFYFQALKPNPDMAKVDSASIPFFDRLYTSSQSAALGTAADVLMVGAALVPAALVPGRRGSELLTLGAMYAETLGLAYALDESLKSIVTRYRPYAYALNAADFSSSDVAASFPSRHATIAFASAVFALSVFDELQPGSPWRPWVWASGLGLATITTVLRVTSGDHFPSDVLAGAALGAALGFLVPLVHKAGPGERSLSLGVGPSGLQFHLRLD